MFIHHSDIKDTFNPFSIMHKATVVYNTDPKKLGRVKCTIDDLFTDITNNFASLPWIYPISSTMLGGSKTVGLFSVPIVGSELIVTFPYKDINFPFYIGYWQSSLTHPVDFDTNYPNVYGFRDSLNNVFKVDTTTGNVTFTHTKGTIIKIDGSTGNVTIGDDSATKEYIVMEAKLITKYNAHTHAFTEDNVAGVPKQTAVPTTSLSAGDIASLKHKVGV